MKPFPPSLPARFLLGTLLLLAPLAGCDTSDPGPDAQSRIQVLLTDAPLDEIVAAEVVVLRVELLGEGDRVLLLADDPQPFDLMTLQAGVTAPLADLDIPDGTYHQLRVVVADTASVTFSDGEVEALTVPSGTQTGIKINLPALSVDEDVVEVTVDFDVEDSFVRRGNSGKGYIFKPVLRPLAVVVNGESMPLEDE
jgi:hypothetical protein